MQVQNTNDSSIVSKLSSSEKEYFEDKWLIVFVDKPQRRSPIINRGYYIRYKAIEAAFQSWFAALSTTKKDKSQIISLGAGFDTSYFRLKSTSYLPSGCKYIEVDYSKVMHRKLKYIQNSDLTSCFNINADGSEKHPNIIASNGEYVMLGLDLKNYNELKQAFKALHIDFSAPSLFLSECAVTYMDVESSNSLIKWIQQHFPNSAFVTYEQVCPNDGFGIVMQNHFNVLSCPLKSLPSYPDKESQYSRYTQMGWKLCSSISMFEFFMSFDEKEKYRVRNLELFDEFEMWHEKCHHYLLIWASQGIVKTPEMFRVKSAASTYTKNVKTLRDWVLSDIPDSLQRFGHQVALLSARFLVLSGGFGHLNKKHQRLCGLDYYDLTSKTCNTALVSEGHDLLGKRMFHSMVILSSGSLVTLGGRSSPTNVYDKVVEIQCKNIPSSNNSNEDTLQEEISFSVKERAIMAPCTWRQSASVIEVAGIETIFLFGGCTSQNNATNICSMLNTKTWKWSKVDEQDHSPSPRHSHSSVSMDSSKVVITGGLCINENILNTVHMFDAESYLWSTISVPGLLPRYSHTSHFWNNRLFLVGGITSISGYSLSIGVIHLDSLVAIEYICPVQDPMYPILLSNHCSYLHEDQIIITDMTEQVEVVLMRKLLIRNTAFAKEEQFRKSFL
ncbi:hypothetical protein JTE90_000268 [Oedothorax gibbosus]|uniref:tRNA wybutosine-synthesizing protein 4 n=1 Tax=Oedothorax gibbosus TaxID=931172 RepID=A0AAV6VTG2_9ARAC|nr:hypothetical protein JTE90_000268 [Oedothorax gibbosus]